ncbi:MAG TPA: TolC family protein [Pyrinomonadaceae bacterium]|jgi:HAE1 family hydrophobic/amphiphilic exporter-1
MKSLRFYALSFTLSAVVCGFNAVASSAQTQTTTPQIAKITGGAATAKEENPPVRDENQPSITFSNRKSNLNLSRTGVQTSQTIPLTLGEAIRRALENNNDIEVAKNDVRIAEQTLRSLLGFYDPEFTLQPNLDRNSTTGRAATTDFRLNSDYTQQIKPGGGTVRAFLDNSRVENQFAQQQVTSSNASTATGAVFSTSLGVTYSQPLWRNFKTDITRRQVKIQRKRVSQSDADFRRQAILVISQVQTAYWDLVFSLRNQQNQVANVNLSRENLRQIEAKINAGVSAPLEKAEILTELATREGDLLSAAQQVSTAENRLKQLFLRDPNASEWIAQIVPTDTPVLNDDPIDLDAAMKDAMEFRPELSRLRLQKEINKIDVDYFKNQTKPRVDLVSTLSLDGLALGSVNTNSFQTPLFDPTIPGTTNSYFYNLICNSTTTPAPSGCGINNIPVVTVPGTPSIYNGGFNRSFANLFRSDAPNFTVGVTFSFPLRNKTAKADLAGARLETERIDAQTRSQEQAVIAEVRNAVQAVETARQRIDTTRRARENAEIQLEGERKKFEVGRSTTFFLFQRENTLTNARNAEIRAETDYNKALSELQRVTSTTFRVNNIQVDSPMNGQ